MHVPVQTQSIVFWLVALSMWKEARLPEVRLARCLRCAAIPIIPMQGVAEQQSRSV